MSICIGEVIAINGLKIIIKANDISHHDFLFHNGKKYRGISIREHILIERGFRYIVARIEGEQLDESRLEKNESAKETETRYLRKLEAKAIGFFDKDVFSEGHKYLPMIKDKAYLASEEQIKLIFGSKSASTQNNEIKIGATLTENITVNLPWSKLFTSHIGIFGNTGSGKSNTLTKLYTELFEKKSSVIRDKSKFVVIDFNGEYTNEQLTDSNYKLVCNLDTRNKGGEKIPIRSDYFWNTEVLSVLFKASENTQKPYLNRLVEGRKKYQSNESSIFHYCKNTFKRVFTASEQKKECRDLCLSVAKLLGLEKLKKSLETITWYNANNQFVIKKEASWMFFDSDNIKGYEENVEKFFNEESFLQLDFFIEFQLRMRLQLINDLQFGHAQFEHIQPLLKRAESSISTLEKVLEIKDSEISTNFFLTIISLRKCNQEIKKVIPLLLAKQYYENQKVSLDNQDRPNKTLHLIIDEAHNILSSQSMREQESWKDYRLELFEEIIKEGRKFGVFLTLASQRPADISPTIMSQLHNFFIHRLVNDRDLALLDNTISTLDSLSKSMIPNLAKGCCVVTGTVFDIPMVLQIDLLDRVKQPDSEDVNLEELWS